MTPSRTAHGTAVDDSRPPAVSVRPTARRPWLAGFAALNALAAWGGAIALVFGGVDFGERTNARLPFDSLVLAGLALAAIVAVPLTVLARSAWVGSDRADDLALIAGSMLIGWIVVQVLVLRTFSLFQPAYLGVGVVLVAASHRVRLGRFRGVVLVAVGATSGAVGVGLAPYVVKSGLAILSVVSVVLVLAGIALVVVGARSTLRGHHVLGKLAGGVVVLAAVAVAVVIIGPAVAATHVPPTEVTSTPADVGLEYESVTLTTTDEVELAAWYLPGTNGAGLVVMHGAGSTRSAVLDQSAVLAGRGYGLLLIDARGHGDSEGSAMDFGWFGDLDVAAGTEFLASRTEVDSGRIGVVGFSMGGEEAIGAAASDPHIRAVVAEGVTGRRAADDDWYSDVYGWRGWIQERLGVIRDAVTDFFTEASPPTQLRSAVSSAGETRFLLITAGQVADEGHAASFIRSADDDRVTVWDVEGADHTGGYDTRPDEWQRYVIDFLDESLPPRDPG